MRVCEGGAVAVSLDLVECKRSGKGGVRGGNEKKKDGRAKGRSFKGALASYSVVAGAGVRKLAFSAAAPLVLLLLLSAGQPLAGPSQALW